MFPELLPGRFARSAPFLLLASFMLLAAPALAAPLRPFAVTNQSPLVLPFNLPEQVEWHITPPGSTVVSIATDLASTYTEAQTAREKLLLDGESWRTTLRVCRGITTRGEIGLELPVMGIGGGTFDGFITGWHDFFGLPQGGRDTAPRNRLHYRYVRDGVTRLAVTSSGSGFGDLRLTGGWQLLHDDSSALALRGSLTLPTGSSGDLRGSGAYSGSLWLTGGSEQPVPIGRLAAWGALGGMVLGNGDILPDQQRTVVGFGALGAGWAPAGYIDFKLQLNGNTPLYSGSDLTPLSGMGAVLTIGGALHFSPAIALDIGVSEDLHVGAAADVALHLRLRSAW